MILCVEISIYLKNNWKLICLVHDTESLRVFCFFAASFMGKTVFELDEISYATLCFVSNKPPWVKIAHSLIFLIPPIRNKKVITQKHFEMFVQNSHCKRDLRIYWTNSLASVRDLPGPRYWRSLYSHFVIGRFYLYSLRPLRGI